MNAVRRRYLIAALIAVLSGGSPSAVAQEPPLANGVFLVAKPDLLDPNFQEAVVLITEPGVGVGPLGVIVNRPFGARLSEVVPDAPKIPEKFDAIYGGGPVARNRLLFLVRTQQRPERSLRVLADVYLSGDPAVLEQVERGEVTAFRAYAGYSSWAPGQLQSEILRGGWYVVQADAEMIFADEPAGMWAELIKRIAAKRAALGKTYARLR
ncbi:MAG TPA: YqgE/AlgH family protein [Burkholderiales bacterium]|nr:YqgE/AlgH family protein [Burkholderiales bacterium]